MASQMIVYAEAVMDFCRKTITGNWNNNRVHNMYRSFLII